MVDMSFSKSRNQSCESGLDDAPLSRTDHRETAENYQGELFRHGIYRVAVCRDGIQWLFQHQRPQFPAGGAAWDTLGYCVSKSGLSPQASVVEPHQSEVGPCAAFTARAVDTPLGQAIRHGSTVKDREMLNSFAKPSAN